ncbi:MAG: tetratricopeptide repeat protein [Crocosphaera sp.]
MDINQDKNQGEIKNYIADQITINNALVPPQPLIEIPQNIPYIGTDIFVGRVKDLENIDKILDKNQSLAITSVTGMGGVGKTELAVQYALRYQQNYLGGICWIEAKRSDIMGQIISFCQSVDINPPDYLQTIQDRLNYCWNHWLEGDVLLIFDDVQSYNNIKNSLPPKNNKFKVVITSCQKLGRLQQLKLQVLEPPEALELLKQIVGEQRINNELETANHLCEWLGYLPLGLELVGRYICNDDFLSIGKTLELLNGEKLAAEALLNPNEDEGDMTAQLGVAAAFKLSWDKLSAEGQKLGCYLSLFGSDLFEWSWVESSNVYDAEILKKARRDDLLKYDLLQVNKEEDRDKPLLSYHPLVYQYFASKFQELEDKEELKHKFCKSLIRVAQSIGDNPTLKEIKKFEIAVPHLEIIATAMRDNIDEEDIGWPFQGLGRFYAGQTNYEAAEIWYKHCLTVCQELFGKEHEYVAESMNNLALLYHLQGKYEAAEPLLVEGLAMDKKLLGCEHLDVAVSMNNLAELYKLQGKLEEAKKIFVDALAMKKKLLGDEQPDVAQSMNNLALLYHLQGKYEAAEPLLVEGLTMRKKLLGDEHPHVANTMNSLAVLYDSQGKYEAAKSLYIDALAMSKKLLGDEHPHVANTMNNLAFLYYSEGKYELTEPLYIDALSMSKKLLGDEHPDVAMSMNNLAKLYYSQGKYEAAEPLYVDAIKIFETVLGNDHPWTVNARNNYQKMLDEMV